MKTGLVTRNTFVEQLSKQHGVIDLNSMSPELTKALQDNGVTTEQLKQLAGPDGRIKGAEFGQLFKIVDGFDTSKEKNAFLAQEPPAQAGEAPKPTVSGQLYDALKNEVARNRQQARFQAPRTQSAPAQTRRVADSNALVVPEKDRKPDVNLGITGLNQFTYGAENGLDGGKACFATSVAQAEQYNKATFKDKAPMLNGSDQAIQMAYQEDANGRVVVDPDQARLGREYIDKCLDKGYPVVVGASYQDASYNNDKMTDHFVTIDRRGHDDKGRLFYEYKDPGDSGRVGRLYVDKDTGKLFKEGDQKTGYVRSADYEFTQVRTYKGVD